LYFYDAAQTGIAQALQRYFLSAVYFITYCLLNASFCSLSAYYHPLQQQTATPARFSAAELPPGVWLCLLELDNGSVLTLRIVLLPH
jgi:hypothetical protein